MPENQAELPWSFLSFKNMFGDRATYHSDQTSDLKLNFQVAGRAKAEKLMDVMGEPGGSRNGDTP